MSTKWGKICLHASLGLCLGLGTMAQAQELAHGGGGYGPVYVPPSSCCPAPIPAPATALPTAPSTQPVDPTRPAPQAEQPVIPPEQAMATPGVSDFASGAADSTGSMTSMLGRADSLNRFNIFDAKTAIPINQVWFGYQYLQNFNSGTLDPAFNGGNESLYRVGAEVVFGENFSLAFQTQYIATMETEAQGSWANPLIMLKYAFIRDCGNVWSAVLGYQPETSLTEGEIRDPKTRIYPGLLFYRDVGDYAFMQGAAQFGLPFGGGDPITLDYALSLGYWLLGKDACNGCNSCCNSCNGCNSCCNSCNDRFLTGIIPQVEILAMNTLGQGNPTIDGLETHQARQVYDLTLGGQILLRNSIAIGNAISFPLTGPSVRRTEYLMVVSYRF